MFPRSSSRIAAVTRSTSGALHLPSIITAAVVVGILTAGTLATVFGVLPFAQDNGARQALAAARTAEAVSYARDGDFADYQGLAERSYLQRHPGLDIGTSNDGKCYLAVARSGSGTAFYSTHRSNDAQILTPSTPNGCLTPRSVQALIDSQGGWDPEEFAPTGTGEGTAADLGTGVIADSPDPAVADSPVGLTSMLIRDRDVTVELANTSTGTVKSGYLLKATCVSTTTGTVTVESITGHVGIGPNTVTGVTISACSPGNIPIGVAAHSAREFGLAQGTVPVRNAAAWKRAHVYYQAMPIVRGGFAAGGNCVENSGQGTVDGNPVILGHCSGADSQRWQWNGYGPVTQAGLEGKCLTLPTGSASFVLAGCDSSDGQHFSMVRAEDGSIQILHPASGTCLDTRYGKAAANSPLGHISCSKLTTPWALPYGADAMVPGSLPNDPVPPPSSTFQGAPQAPENVAVIKYVGSGVHVSWTPVEGATAYRLDATGTKTTYAADGTPTVENISVTATVIGGATRTGSIKVPSGTEGQITVTALNGSEESAPSAPVAISVPKSSVIL